MALSSNAHDGGDGQTGQVDRHTGDREGQAAHRVEAQRRNEDDSRDDQVAAVGKVHLILDHVAHTNGGDHAIEHKADTADDAGGDGVDDGLKLGAEAQDDGQHSGNADDEGVVDLAQGQHAGVLAVGGVGRAAQQASQRGGQTVAQQGAVQAGVIDIVVADGGADGGDIAHMLHHGSQGDGDDGKERADKLGAAVDGKQAHGILMQRDAEPVSGSDGLEIHGTGHEGHCVGDQHADEDGQDLDHALAPDVADDDRAQCHKGQQPVGLAVVDGRGSQDQTDGDDDGAGDNFSASSTQIYSRNIGCICLLQVLFPVYQLPVDQSVYKYTHTNQKDTAQCSVTQFDTVFYGTAFSFSGFTKFQMSGSFLS